MYRYTVQCISEQIPNDKWGLSAAGSSDDYAYLCQNAIRYSEQYSHNYRIIDNNTKVTVATFKHGKILSENLNTVNKHNADPCPDPNVIPA